MSTRHVFPIGSFLALTKPKVVRGLYADVTVPAGAVAMVDRITPEGSHELRFIPAMVSLTLLPDDIEAEFTLLADDSDPRIPPIGTLDAAIMLHGLAFAAGRQTNGLRSVGTTVAAKLRAASVSAGYERDVRRVFPKRGEGGYEGGPYAVSAADFNLLAAHVGLLDRQPEPPELEVPSGMRFG